MKRKVLAVLMSALMLAAAVPSVSVLADGQKVVTLGADLTEDQKQTMLRYFGVAGQPIQTLTITNQDERNHLGAYVPLEQIGTRTFSCALVSPTTSGGIQVKTANLSWVTSNMIASTLSTSGVTNCDVLAAAPFEVSGTGALTGILMAYESAVGATLDSTKKEVATQELITTTNIANNIGQVQATEIVNETKIQVIQGQVVNENEISTIIEEVAAEENISLTDADRELLTQLLQEIAAQDYDYEDMQETLERVEANMQEYAEDEDTESALDGAIVIDGASTETPETVAADSILNTTDDSALGDTAIFDATDSTTIEGLPQQTEVIIQTEAPTQDDTVYVDGGALAPDGTVVPEDSIITEDQVADETVVTEAPAAEDEIVEDGTTAEGTVVDGTVVEDAVVDGTVSVDGTDEVVTEDPNAGITTLQLELIPLSELVLNPLTSDSTGYQVYAAGSNELSISFQRSDVLPGSGTITLYNAADSSIIETINMQDTTKVGMEALSNEELTKLGWAGGNKVVVYLSSPLKQSTSYFVALSEDALSSIDGIGHSEATPDAYTWTIQTSEYGFGLDKTPNGITAGSSIAGQVMMDGTAATRACIENADPAVVTFDTTEFMASGSFTATFAQAGTTSFQVSFYDEAGSVLNTINYSVTVK